MECAFRDSEIRIDTLGKARKNRADGNEKYEPSAPIPTMVVAVLSVGIVHIADIEFHVADEVVIGYEDTGNGTHETRITREEGKELGTLDDDLPR